MIGRECVEPPERGCDGNPSRLRELDQRRNRFGPQYAASRDDDRLLGVLQQLHHIPRGRGADRRCDGRGNRQIRFGYVLFENVAAQNDADRPRASAHAESIRLAHQPGKLGCARGLDRPFGDFPEKRRELDLLQRLSMPKRRFHLPDHGQHRGRVLIGGVNADRKIRGADPARAHADRRLPDQLGCGVRHECRAALMPASDQIDLRCVIERVEQSEEALPGHPEGISHAAIPQQPRCGQTRSNHQWLLRGQEAMGNRQKCGFAL